MPFISLSNIPMLPTKQHNARHRKRHNKPRLPISIETIAQMIDPGAWVDKPQPSRERLEVELAKAKELITALRDEIDWLSVGRSDALKNPVLIQRAGRDILVVDDITDQRQRQQRALQTAQDVVDVCKKVLGQRRMIFIKGYVRRRASNDR